MESCYHCGDDCRDTTIVLQDKHFCCNGCKTVYEILNENDLTYYYDLEQSPGISPIRFEGKFDYLKDEQIASKLLEFNEQDTQIVNLLIPSIHCSSCIWVLEHLGKINNGIISSQVNFPEKTVRIQFNTQALSLFNVVQLLTRLGYEPYISLEDDDTKQKKTDRSLIYKLGVAGFAFGNIMFLSFPEYFEVDEFWLDRFKFVFRWLMFLFALPVVFYSGWDYFISAFKGLRSKLFNIDVPIALGISVLFVRSALEVILDIGTGFFDSLSGLVFFLLLGKFFQKKTYAYLSFERDYRSYFPLAVTQLAKDSNEEKQTQIKNLQPGDRILIRNEELIPVDAILISGNAFIDYSFVTGETQPVAKSSGSKVFAGGRQAGGSILLEVINAVEQSYLTQLWSNDVFNKKNTSAFQTLTDQISKRFTLVIISIAILALGFWLWYLPAEALNVFTAVLIVACPCAIALAAPFTLGNILRYFGKAKLYLKNAEIIERMSQLDTLVFDKTGTLTTSEKNNITYHGKALNPEEQNLLTNTLRSSNHPLSRALYQWLQSEEIYTLDDFKEDVGKGIHGSKNKQHIYAGSLNYINQSNHTQNQVENHNTTQVHVATSNDYKGFYSFCNDYRNALKSTFNNLKKYNLIVLSGDNDNEREALSKLLPKHTEYFFNQKPEDKLDFIKKLQSQGKKVLMLGDGLNDAGALAQSDVGIAISENINVFSPACDGILDANQFSLLPKFFSLSRKAIRIIKYAFIFSLLYNLIGLGFAITGHLKPVIAAILMPLSSISIVVFTTIYTYLVTKKLRV
ncbi:MAG: heavy metal translocating P-type ATPase [Winogradskyella sp.]|uniref:heavy metal translocating P-type ATPase n=1 Tax=Winogradskyella sp. TaxID=1883156 RepID=UPI000F40E0A5|nr:heavy metal translocating P-type ATPase metal-binding domain-containing protein [Winogradskyella sp.]RNC87230.1 MAG: heavy metal translocating P-type ATPase [Winogradskyella sp.]